MSLRFTFVEESKEQELAGTRKAEEEQPAPERMAPQKSAPQKFELWQTRADCQWRSPDGLVVMYEWGDLELFPAGVELPRYWRKIADNPPGYEGVPLGRGRLRAAVRNEWETGAFGAQSRIAFRKLDLGDELSARAAVRRERLQAQYDRPLDMD